MMLRGAIGLGVSIAVHTAAGVGLIFLLLPKTMPPQAVPKAEMMLETATVTKSQATSRDTEGTNAASVAPDNAAALGNPVPRKQARPLAVSQPRMNALQTEDLAPVLGTTATRTEIAASKADQLARPISAASPDSNALTDLSITGDVAYAATPESVSMAAGEPDMVAVSAIQVEQTALVPRASENRLAATALINTAQITAGRAKSAVVAPLQTAGQVVAPKSAPMIVSAAMRPDSVRPVVYRPEGKRLIADRPVGTAVSANAPNGAVAREGQRQETLITAAMAFSGGEEMALDPAALLAVTAFIAPEQAGGDGQDLRDGISGVLSSVPCARLQTAFDAETGVLELRGHVPKADMRTALTAALRAQIDDALPVAERLQVLPEPQCGTLGRVAALGLPQSEEQFTDPALIGENLFVREYVFQRGDRMTIELEGADYPAFLYVDYFDAQGNVLHLMPNETLPSRPYAPGETFRIGAENSGLELIVEPPFGQDIAVAFASDTQLYDGLRPIVEPAGEYLDFLQTRIAAVAPERAEWVYLMVQSVEAD